MVKTIKVKLNDDQKLSRRRNIRVLDADIVDLEMEIKDAEFMLENNVAEKRLRRQLAIARSKKESSEQNKTLMERELKKGEVEMEANAPNPLQPSQ